TAERPAGQLGDQPDRRGASGGPRRSWASPEPFDRRRTPSNRPDRLRATSTWSIACARYVLLALGCDVLLASAAAGATLSSVLGQGPAALWGGAATGLGFALMVATVRGYDPRRLGD